MEYENKTDDKSSPIADVVASEMMDRLVVVPRRGTDIVNLLASLRYTCPSMSVRQATEGISIPAEYSHMLLMTDGILNIQWRAEARIFAENRKRSHEVHFSLRNKVESIKSSGVAAAKVLIENLKGIELLDDHQIINIAAMTLPECRGLCIFDEQGTGKTVTLIFAFDLLVELDIVDTAIVIAPKSMISEWPNDLFRFKGDLYKSVMVTGSYSEKRQKLSSEADFYVTNFETAVSMEAELLSLIRKHNGRIILAIDESFFVKNLDAKRTKAIRRLREWCSRAYVLCGTPAPNSPQDLVQQFNIVDFGFTFSGVKIPEEHENARLIVQQAMEERGIYTRHLKENVLPNLPQKSFQRVLIPLEPIQANIYYNLLCNLITELTITDEYTFRKTISSFLAKRAALLQVCSNPVSIVTPYVETPAKLKALDEIIREIVERQREKAIIWSFYTASLNAIFARYSELSPVRYDGSVTSVLDRREAVRRFQDDDSTKLFIGNPAAAGAGLTLHRARYAIYESFSNQAAHYLQSIDRIHRRGQERNVEYIVLLCDKTVEIQEYDRLTDKENTQHLLLGDKPIEVITRESMLVDLLKAKRLFDAK